MVDTAITSSPGVVVPLRPRAEVPRSPDRLPPKSRRRYSRDRGYRYRSVGRLQTPMRWVNFGKMLMVDFRLVMKRDPRTLAASKELPAIGIIATPEAPSAENSFVLHVADDVPATTLLAALADAGFSLYHDQREGRLVLGQAPTDSSVPA